LEELKKQRKERLAEIMDSEDLAGKKKKKKKQETSDLL
jgi:hypothetical protein